MIIKKFIYVTFAFCLSIFATQASADIRVFEKNSLADIEARHAEQAFLLVMWSIDCAPCRDEMKTLAEANRQYKDLPVVLVSTDEAHHRDEVAALLAQHDLSELESWIFPASQKMAIRYAIDPGWYGELPRTYFYNAAHERVGKSGALEMHDVESLVQMIKRD